ncbi:MAG: dihydrofolate reductase family protein [Bacteriovoracaceae bacterium]|nr:dihydrofolate reductase family protein [Bacteroidota bacterium]
MTDDRRKVILYIAMSLDGFIAGEDGDIGWLSCVEKPGEDYGYAEFIASVDTVILGRKTYDKVLSFGIPYPHADKTCYIITRSNRPKEKNIIFYRDDLSSLVERLKQEDGKHIFVDGGAEIVQLMQRENLIDEYVISIMPMLLGKGIRLFKETAAQENVSLISSRAFDTGLVQLQYRTKRNAVHSS